MNDTPTLHAGAVEATAIVHAAPDAMSPIFGTSDPEEIVEKAAATARALKKVIDQQGLSVVLKKGADPYLELEAWLLFGAAVGVSVGTGECRRDPEAPAESWIAKATVYNRAGVVIGHAEGTCGRDERNWKDRDSYALKSMAQTRAASQAMRRALGFLAVLAGYNPTPAAEMPRDTGPDPEATITPARAAKIADARATMGVDALNSPHSDVATADLTNRQADEMGRWWAALVRQRAKEAETTKEEE